MFITASLLPYNRSDRTTMTVIKIIGVVFIHVHLNLLSLNALISTTFFSVVSANDYAGGGDDFFSGISDVVSLECQNLAKEFLNCFTSNTASLFNSPKCIEFGILTEDGGAFGKLGEFRCEEVPQVCSLFTCSETCAESAENFINCQANENGCSATCDGEIDTIPSVDDNIVAYDDFAVDDDPVPPECRDLATEFFNCFTSNQLCYENSPKCQEIGDPGLENEFSCKQVSRGCSFFTCCETCAESAKNYLNCEANTIGCSEICEGGDDGIVGGDDSVVGSDNIFGDDDSISVECQDLAMDFSGCISFNSLCLMTSPKCIELGVINEDGGALGELEDTFSCDQVPQLCTLLTCCETCADKAINFINCQANVNGCSVTCDDNIGTLPSGEDDLTGGGDDNVVDSENSAIDDDSTSSECQTLANDISTCFSSNQHCYATTPKCQEIGDSGLEDDFSCDQVTRACSYLTCCEACAESAEKYMNCLANTNSCSETCEGDKDGIIGGGDNIVGGDGIIVHGSDDFIFDNDSTSVQCQNPVEDFSDCISSNLSCLLTNPKCIELGVLSEGGGVLGELGKEFSCQQIPEYCELLTCCETCAESAKRFIKCEAIANGCGGACSNNIITLPNGNDNLIGGGDDNVVGGSNLIGGGGDDVFGSSVPVIDYDSISSECLDLANIFFSCFIGNQLCYGISPMCLLAGNFEMEDEFSCDKVSQSCTFYTCCKTCAESAENYISCEANANGCSETCDVASITPMPIPLAPVTPEPTSFAPVTSKPTSLAQVTPKPTFFATVRPLPTTSAPVVSASLPDAPAPLTPTPLRSTPAPVVSASLPAPVPLTHKPIATPSVTIPPTPNANQTGSETLTGPSPEKEESVTAFSRVSGSFMPFTHKWVQMLLVLFVVY